MKKGVKIILYILLAIILIVLILGVVAYVLGINDFESLKESLDNIQEKYYDGAKAEYSPSQEDKESIFTLDIGESKVKFWTTILELNNNLLLVNLGLEEV